MRQATPRAHARTAAYWQQTFHNRVLLVVLAMVVLVPLLAFPSNQAMQDIANKALQLMAALLAGLLVMRARVATRGSEIVAFLATGPNLAVLLYLASAVLSLFLGPADPLTRRLGLNVLQQIVAGILLYFALAYHVRRSDHFTKIMDALVQVAGLMALLGLSMLAAQSGEQRADLFGNSQLFAAFLLALFPLPLLASLTERDLNRKIIAQVSLILCIVGLLMSGLRSAWIGVAGMLLAMGLFHWAGSPRHYWIRALKSQYLIPLLTVVACCILAMAQGDVSRMIRLRIDAGGHTLELRQRYWHAARQLVILKPVFGTGLGTYPVLQQTYSQLGRPSDAVLHSNPALGEMAHSVWLQTAAEQGLVGVAFYGTIVVTFLLAGVERLRYCEGVRRLLLLATLSSIVGASIDGLSNPAWHFGQISMYWWLMLGLGVACLRPRAPHTEEEQHQEPSARENQSR